MQPPSYEIIHSVTINSNFYSKEPQIRTIHLPNTCVKESTAVANALKEKTITFTPFDKQIPKVIEKKHSSINLKSKSFQSIILITPLQRAPYF